MDLFFNKIGDKKEVLIILHGIFGTGDNWISIARQLTDQFTIYLIDQRNHGKSPHSTDFNYDLMVDDLKKLIDTEHLEQIYLLGHSMGGKVAMRFALSYPDLIKRLVIVDIAPRFYTLTQHARYIKTLLSVPLATCETRAEVEMQIKSVIDDIGTRQFLMKNLARNEEGVFFWRINLQSLLDNLDEVGKMVSSNDFFDKPTLFIRGEQSQYILYTDFDDIAKLFHQADILTIRHAGHWVHADQPDLLLTHLRLFLAN